MGNQNYWNLDAVAVRRLLVEQELKKWWVAECAGVHKTTLRRWLSGKIARVKQDNLCSLARVLNVPTQRIGAPGTQAEDLT